MKKLIPFLLVLIVAAAVLVSCGKTDEKDPDVVTLRGVDNISEYVIVKGENTSQENTAAAYKISKAIKEALGIEIDIKTDNKVGKYEILVGETNREESIEAHKELRSRDYIIRRSGNKIVIAGGCNEALDEVVEIFKEKFIISEKQKIYAPVDNDYLVKKSYAFDKLTVNGVDISRFSIITETSEKDIAALTNGITDMVGACLKISSDVMSDDGYYIIINSDELIMNNYSVAVDDRNITITASHKSISAALDAFVDCLDGLTSKNYDLTSADSFEGKIWTDELYTKEQLIQLLEQIYADPDKLIVGEQAIGSNKNKDPDGVAVTLNSFRKATGQMPGIIGIDLGCYGFDLMSVSEDDWSQYIGDLVEYAYGGGIITISSHWANPSGNIGERSDKVRGNLGYDDTLEGYEKAFTDLITEGTEYNTLFKTELDANARFLKALQDNGVPVIWRPLHEANGGWFWYCIRQNDYTLDPSYFTNIWKYVYKYFTENWGLTELIWCYGPNYSKNINDNKGSTMSATYLYPGDEYCDIVGVDWYTGGELEISLNDNYPHFVDQVGKIGSLTEFGPGDLLLTGDISTQVEIYNCMDMYDDLVELIEKGYSFAYLLTWTTRYGITGMGLGDEFMETDLTLGQAEVKELFDALK